MADKNGKGISGFGINPKGTDPWIWAIGKIMINFGAVEALSYVLIDKLTRDPLLHDLALDMPFKKRISVIEDMIEREDIPEDLKQEANGAWQRASKMADFRNQIAHNPLVFGWHGQERDAPPDFIGVPHLKKMKGQMQRIVPLADIEQLNASVNAIVEVARNLEEILNNVVEKLNAKNT